VLFMSKRSGVLATISAAVIAATFSGSVLAAGPTVPTGTTSIKGQGASFPAPIYNYWASKFKASLPGNKRVQFSYAATGSGSGIAAITNNPPLANFGASDAAMSNTEIGNVPNANGDVLHVPMVLGAVALGINVKQCSITTLTLTGANIGDIYQGKIKNWNDSSLRSNGRNNKLSSCNLKITPVRRSDSSGTTFVFTSYLKQKTTPYWASKGSLPTKQYGSWPTGVGAVRNSGVALKVKNTPGGIGYMELSYANQASLLKARVQNGAKSNFVAPTSSSTSSAANNWNSANEADLRYEPVIGANGFNSYPIVAYTFVLLLTNAPNQDKGLATLGYLYWSLTSGQGYASSLGYAPLPAGVKAKSINQLHKVKSGGNALWP